MPPWPATRGFGDFENDRSMTQLELELITSWIDGGFPEGQVSPMTPQPAAADPPDLLLQTPISGLATGSVQHRLLPPLRRDVWVRGWDFRPAHRRAVLGASIRTGDGQLLGSWVASQGPVMYPVGTGIRLAANSRLSLEISYRKGAQFEPGSDAVGLWLASEPPRFLVRSRRVPCGSTRLEESVDVLSVTPWTPVAGTAIEVVAHQTGGRVDPLVVVNAYDPQYPVNYRFRQLLRSARVPSSTCTRRKAGPAVRL